MTEIKTLLIVEDDAITREVLADLLHQAGYTVLWAANGAQALASLSTMCPDLILLDMLMPVLDGWHFLEQLKAQHIPPIPIIVVTATVLTREWAEDHGCRGFIAKPIEPLAMLEEIQRCLETQELQGELSTCKD